MQALVAKRLAELKAKLNITPTQEGAWTTFTAAMQPPAGMAQRMGWRQSPEQHAEIASEVLGSPPLPRRLAGRTADDDEELDRLLDRVREVGIAGLTDADRRRLTELSALRGGGARR